MGVILRSPAYGGTTKNLILTGSAEILRGVYPAPVEGLRMICRRFWMETSSVLNIERQRGQAILLSKFCRFLSFSLSALLCALCELTKAPPPVQPPA
jgi:hypothetical protein